MAVSSRTMARHRDYSRLFIALAVLAGVVAITPIAAAVLGVGGASVSPRTAFASAPSGEYAVLSRSEGGADVIVVARSGDGGAVTEVARVRRLEGFPSPGAVSPDGKYLALVTVDGGTPTRPVASLVVVGLETGRLVPAAGNIAPGQTPLWSPDSKDVVVTRMLAGNEAAGPIDVVRVGRDGQDEVLLGRTSSVLGVYPVGFDDRGRLASVVLDIEGSKLVREGAEPLLLSTGLTRDWKLSPDGAEIAYIEVDGSNGVRYLARTASLLNSERVSTSALQASVVALGAAWNPASKTASFGIEPGQSTSGVSVQALTASDGRAAEGFDVPLAYSPGGGSVAVTHWTGTSFGAAGEPELQLITSSGRIGLAGFTGFLGWSTR